MVLSHQFTTFAANQRASSPHIHFQTSTIMATIVNSEQFKELRSQDTPLVVDFFATWCGPCKKLAPIIDEVSEEVAGKVNVVKIDVDQTEDIAVEYGIRTIPTVLFFKSGEVVDKFVGAVPKAQVLEKVNALL